MTRYVLHGGTEYNEDVYLRDYEFLKEVLRPHNNGVNILLCYFGREPSKWQDSLEIDRKDFSKVAGDKELIFHVADTNRFEVQAIGADVILFGDGDAQLIKSGLESIPNLAGLFVGKTVGVSAAGSEALSKYYYDQEKQSIESGLAVLNIKTICHYQDSMQAIIDKMKFYQEDIRLFSLPDGEYAVIET